jgi:hypothetical protein
MLKIQIGNSIILLLGLPLLVTAFGLASHISERYLGIFADYIAGVVVPSCTLCLLNLLYGGNKNLFLKLSVAFGLIYYYRFFFPSSYPENHELAYQVNYIPTVLVALSSISTFIILLRINNKEYLPTQHLTKV